MAVGPLAVFAVTLVPGLLVPGFVSGSGCDDGGGCFSCCTRLRLLPPVLFVAPPVSEGTALLLPLDTLLALATPFVNTAAALALCHLCSAPNDGSRLTASSSLSARSARGECGDDDGVMVGVGCGGGVGGGCSASFDADEGSAAGPIFACTRAMISSVAALVKSPTAPCVVKVTLAVSAERTDGCSCS